jgi:4-alpha-glucanotransferase
MWSIFQWQDLLGMSEKLRRPDPHEERINVPAIVNYYWRYRMHITLEDLLKENDFNRQLKELIENSGRLASS